MATLSHYFETHGIANAVRDAGSILFADKASGGMVVPFNPHPPMLDLFIVLCVKEDLLAASAGTPHLVSKVIGIRKCLVHLMLP